MSEISKGALTSENNNSFPNNNTGYITPTILRTFNQNMIDSLVDEISYTAESASFNSRINDLDPSGSQLSFAALEAATASLNAYTASQNTINSSVTASIVALQSFSSSLDATFATDAQLNASSSTLQSNINAKLNTSSFNSFTQSYQTDSSSFDSRIDSLEAFSSSLDATFATDAQLTSLSASIAVTDSAQSASIAQLQSFSSSLDATFATDAQLNALSSSIASTDLAQSSSIAALQEFSSSLETTFATDAQLTALSTSIAVTDSAQSSSIAALQQFSSSLDATFATDAQLTALSTSISVTTNNLDLEVNQKLDSSSFNSYTQSNDTKWDNLGNQSGSFITESETGSMSVLSSSFATSASFAVTASYVIGFDSSSLVQSSTFNAYTSSNDSKVNSLTAQTSSYARLGSIQTFTQQNTFNGQTVFNGNVEVTNVPFYVRRIESNNSAGITIDTATNGAPLRFNGSPIITGSVFATNSITASQGFRGDLVGTASFATTASFALNATSVDTGSLVTTASFNSYTASASTAVSGAINSATQSLSSSIAVTTNLLDLEVNGKLDSSSFNSYTSSNDAKVNSLIAATGSYVTEAESGSFLITASFNNSNRDLTFTKGDGSQFAVNIPDVSGSAGDFVTTSSFNSYTASASTAVSASINAATQSLSASIAVTTNNLDLEVNGKLDSSSFNSYTSSNDSKVNALINATSSYVTEAESGSFVTDVSAGLGANILNVTKGNGSVNTLTIDNVTSASYADIAQSASFAQTASFLLGTVASASFALTASEARNVVIIARNGNASSLPAGTIVHITSASGDNPIFNTASYDTELLSANTLGMLRTTATSGADVEVLVNGIVTGVNTDPVNGFVAGDIIYLGPTGSFTRVQPQAPNQIVTIGQVLRAQQNNGSVYVSINNGWELNELHNVAINSAVDGDLLVYRSGSYGLWTNSSSLELGNASTGSNTFVGNQTITGSVTVSGSAAVDLTVIGRVVISGSSGAGNPLLTITSSTNNGTYAANQVTLTGTGTGNAILSSDFGGYVLAYQDDGSEISIAADAASYASGWTKGPAVTVNDPSNTYPAMIGFQNKTNWSDGRITLLRNTDLSGSLRVTNTAAFSSSIDVSGSLASTFNGGIGVIGNPGGNAISVYSGSVEVTSPQGTGFFYSNLPMTSSGLRINGTALVADLIVSGVFAGDSSLQVLGNAAVSGSSFFGNEGADNHIFTGSVRVNGEIYRLGEQVATQGANNFVGDQKITGSLRVDGDFFLDDDGGTTQFLMNAKYFTEFKGIATRWQENNKTASVDMGEGNIALLYYAYGTGYDNGYHIDINSGGTTFSDYNTSYVKQPWLKILPNPNTNPAPQFQRGLGITGSLVQSGSVNITGSVNGNVSALSISSNTASLNLNNGNFFTLQLVSGSDTHIVPSNIKPGQTISLLLNTTGSGTVSFPSSIKQASGSAYVPTTGTGVDVLTLISFDTQSLYISNLKNFN